MSSTMYNFGRLSPMIFSKKKIITFIWKKMNKRIGEIWVEKSFGMQEEIEK